MPDLLDASVWIALSVVDHAHHTRAARFVESEAGGPLALCRVTELALLRLHTDQRVVGGRAMDGAAAWRYRRTLRASPLVIDLGEPDAIDEISGVWGADLDVRGKHWTDACLAAFATASGARLVSFDADFARYPGLAWPHLQPDQR